MSAPLNGVKTHPLTAWSRLVLDEIARAPKPSALVNPGTKDRLLRENLVEEIELPSPWARLKGRKVTHLQITAAGIVVLEQTK